MTIATLVQSLASGDVRAWSGLPRLQRSDLISAFEQPTRSDQEQVLGYYQATLEIYRTPVGQLLVWYRDDTAVMIELSGEWPISVLEELEDPCAILPQEILVDGNYCHEYLFCDRGLVITVAERLKERTKSVIRLRGIRPIEAATDFGPEYYKSLDDQIRWGVE